MIRRLATRSVLAMLATLLLCTAAHAQVFRAYLKSTGSDANPCSLPQPCRLLPAALAAVSNGGEIWMLDSANYNTGPVNVDKSVSILAVPGAIGSIVALGGPALSVTTANRTISLRNVMIGPVVGAAAGTNAIHALTTGLRLVVEKSVISGVASDGIFVSGANNSLTVIDSTIRKCGGYGVSIAEGTRAVVTGVKFIDNVWGGVSASSDTGGSLTTATVSDTVVAGGLRGMFVNANLLALVRVSITRSTFERTAKPVVVSEANGGVAQANLGRSVLAFNDDAWQVFAGTFSSTGTSVLAGAPGIGTKTPLVPQ